MIDIKKSTDGQAGSGGFFFSYYHIIYQCNDKNIIYQQF